MVKTRPPRTPEARATISRGMKTRRSREREGLALASALDILAPEPITPGEQR